MGTGWRSAARWMALGGALDGSTRVWDMRDRRLATFIPGHTRPDGAGGYKTVVQVAFRQVDGKPELITSGLDGTLRFHQLEEGNAGRLKVKSRQFPIEDDKLSADKQPKWDAKIYAMAVEPAREDLPAEDRESVLVFGDSQGRLVWLDLKTFTASPPKAAHPKFVNDIRFHPHRDELVSSGDDGTLKFWDRRGNLLRVAAALAKLSATLPPRLVERS